MSPSLLSASAPTAASLSPSTNTATEEVRKKIAFYDRLAAMYGWQKVRIKTNNSLAQRQRYIRQWETDETDNEGEDDSGGGGVTLVVLDCWPTTGMIGSYLKHPKQGRTQLFRAQCTDEEAQRIFRNPRSHIGKGYHQKQQQQQQQSTATAAAASYPNDDQRKRGRQEDDDGDQNMVNNDDDDDQQHHRRTTKRRQIACNYGSQCRNWNCRYYHPPRCFFAANCWFQPNCWFDHTHGLCRYGQNCYRDDCCFSHRNPDTYY